MGFVAVVLDWDGTVVDSRSATVDAVRAATSEVLGVTYPTTAREASGLLTLRAAEVWGMLTTDDALRLSLVRRFEIEYEQRGDLLRPFPDAASTIAALTSHGVAVAVTTTKSRARLRADAAHCGLSSLVPHPVTADDVNARPPDPRLLEGALELLGVAATDAVAVGDSPEDLMASRAAGVTNAAALYGCCYSREELLRERPDVCLESLQGLVDLVLGGGDS